MSMRNFTLSLIAAAATSIAGAAYAADVYVPPAEPGPAYVPAPAAWSWTGIYFGVNGGYGWGTSTDLTFGNDTSPSGWLAGGQVGVNYQFAGGLVIGLEGAWDWANITDTVDFGTYNVTQTINSVGSIAGRLGFAVDRVLIYGRAGWAWAGSTRNFDPDGFGPPGGFSDSATLSGWTGGVGAEYAITNNLIGRLQFDYYNFGTATYVPLATVNVRNTLSTITAGVSLKF